MNDVGIAVMTRNRRAELTEVLDAIEKHTRIPYDFVVSVDRSEDDTVPYLLNRYKDSENFTLLTPVAPGMAGGRNTILHHFRNHKIVFTFEDDYLPVVDSWEENYLKVLADGDVPALFGLRGPVHGPVEDTMLKMVSPDGAYVPVVYRERVTTQMLAVNTGILNTLGYFNPAYGARYGFEDSEWACRGRDSGLFLSKLGFPALDDEQNFREVLDPKSSDRKTLEEREADIEDNNKIFVAHKERPVFLPYPYEE